ncbi:MAG: antibiotic biosynthesis monooxygenase [Anaerolineae bacterium]|nr:antibiotic biosynthesis monooxygenase [Anaerolineae bacterium]
MILTQLEGRVAPEQWDALKQAFSEGTQQLPSAIYQTYLIQDEDDSEVWRILTIWHSREALQAYRASVETPGGILMFQAAGAEPTLSIYNVIDHARTG